VIPSPLDWWPVHPGNGLRRAIPSPGGGFSALTKPPAEGRFPTPPMPHPFAQTLRPALLVLAPLLLAPASRLAAQEAAPAPATVQQKTQEWIETRRLIGEETAAWQAEKATLSSLTDIRRKEIEQLGEFIEAGGARVDELAQKRAAFAKEESDLRAWRSDLDRRLASLEEGLRPLVPRFPPPLRQKVEESLLRLESPDPESPLQNRARDLLLVLQAFVDFQNSVSLDREVREIDGERREVEVLYLGMAQAWYVDATGRHSGSGVPGEDGWTWSADPSLAPRVRAAVEIQARRAQPAFVELPITNPAAASPRKEADR
jgi:hypothetical protein